MISGSDDKLLCDEFISGAYPASKVDRTFVASHQLSELVWCPRKGLSLRCADCCFADNKTFVLPGAGPISVILSPTQIITAARTSYDKPIMDNKNIITSKAIFHAPRDVAGRDTMTGSPGRDAEHNIGASAFVEGTNSSATGPLIHLEQNTNSNKGLFIDNEEPEVLSGYLDHDIDIMNRALGLEAVVRTNVQSSDECEAPITNVLGLTSQTRSNEEQTSRRTTRVLTPERVESTDENDVQDIYQRNQEILHVGNTVSLKHSPSNCRVHVHQRKCKRKALSAGDVRKRMSKEHNDSHESVESCNTAGLLGSKRAKKQIQGTPDSRSLLRQDGSFVNWISNMMKGFKKSKDDGTPSLALNFASPNQTLESSDKKPISCNKGQDSGVRNTGFQSVFRSIYSSNTKVAALTNPICNTKAAPIACHDATGSFCEGEVVLNENVDESIAVDVAGPSTKPHSLNFAAIKKLYNTNSPENKNSCRLPFGIETDGMSASYSLGKFKTSSLEQIDSDTQSKPKTTGNAGYRSDLQGSLWISRFCPKKAGPVLDLATSNQTKGEAPGCSTNVIRTILSKDNRRSEAEEQLPEESLIAKSNECQNRATNAEAFAGFNRIRCHTDQKFSYNFDPIIPSQTLKSSDIMASNFARRLDALKYAVSSDNEGHACTTCLFCGIKGHHLRDCPKLTESEIDDLSRNITSYDSAEELPCLCVRCFQLDHWAVACPNASSRRRHQLDRGITDKNPKLPDTNEGKFQTASAFTRLEGSNRNLNEGITTDKRISHSSLLDKCIASISGKNDVREIQITPFCNIANMPSPDIPKGIFDAIKMLRLARTDVLKLMKSCISLSHLNGFFLRLRLGKWEQDLGGTGYHVAYITETQTERSQQTDKIPISVNVGGIKCSVESQYISNHDFLEDELMAWWCTISKSGCEIPSSEDMMAKIQERKMLGF